MEGNLEGIKTRNFGIEIEMTGLTRCQAAKAISKVLGGSVSHDGGYYDKYSVTDEKYRKWSIVYDASIVCINKNGEVSGKAYSVELNSPVLEYEDIPLLQEVVRALRKAGGLCERISVNSKTVIKNIFLQYTMDTVICQGTLDISLISGGSAKPIGIHDLKLSKHCPGLKNKLCKCNFPKINDNIKNAAKQGYAEERPDADCGIIR